MASDQYYTRFAGSSNTDNDNERGNHQGEAYVFAVSWPSASCASKNCRHNNLGSERFNIHGLWPSHKNSCSRHGLQQIPEGSEHYWSGLWTPQESFLNHEWKKHGSCMDWEVGDTSFMPNREISGIVESVRSGTTSRQEGYILLTVALSKHYDLYRVLARERVLPSRSVEYQTAEVEAAIQRRYDITNFRLLCHRTRDQKILGNIRHRASDRSETSLLQEVRLCLDKNFNLPFHAPQTTPVYV